MHKNKPFTLPMPYGKIRNKEVIFVKHNKALNVCGIVVAVLLSVLLFTVLVVTPLAATVQRMTVPDNLSDFIGEIDFTEIVKENEVFKQ